MAAPAAELSLPPGIGNAHAIIKTRDGAGATASYLETTIDPRSCLRLVYTVRVTATLCRITNGGRQDRWRDQFIKGSIMRQRRFSEKALSKPSNSASRAGYIAIIVCQHVLLWTSLYVLGSTSYLIGVDATDENTLPSAIVAIVTASVSVGYVAFHNATVYFSTTVRARPQGRRETGTQRLCTHSLHLALILWLVCCGLSILFTVARHPGCNQSGVGGTTIINIGIPCSIQRSSVGSSLLALIICGAVFVLVHKVEEPYRCHLFGTVQAQALLPLVLPYKTSLQRPMFSEMSFKCRSSTSLSSYTLAPSFNDSTTTLLPARPEKTVGLGIYATKSSTASFLGPRPSLSSIRSHATTIRLPPSSPLPPLPAYFPEKYRSGSAMHKAVYPPKIPSRPARSKSERTVRIVPPSPALSIGNLEAHNKSVESLSSVYSRSISGERYSPRSTERPGPMTNGSRSFSSSSTATVKKSPLGAMRLADRPDVIVVTEEKSRVSSEVSDSQIDDVAMLQAKLPSIKGVSEFGEIQDWTGACTSITSYLSSPLQMTESKGVTQCGFVPLIIEKTRNSAAIFQLSSARGVA